MTTTVPPATVSQHTLAAGLYELLTSHPTLPAASWNIDPKGTRLYGHVHDRTPDALTAYTNALGGTVSTGHHRTERGTNVRTHWLDTTWRDVTITIACILPTEATA